MKIKPEELVANGYVLLDELKHQELIPFLQDYMKKRTKASVFFYSVNFLFLALVGYYFVDGFSLTNYSIVDRFAHLFYGFSIVLFLIPLHEFIHVLAYKSQGARNTSFDANFKKFYFMALADKFVANRKEFKIVALAPFAVISVALIGILFFTNSNGSLTIISALFIHTAMCSGDFGLLSYFEYHKSKKIVTFDDVENKISYFYEELSRK